MNSTARELMAPRSKAWLAVRQWSWKLPRLPLVLAAVLVLVTTLPYAVAYAVQPHDRVFLGFFFLGDDANTYLAKMRQGWEGSWIWTNRYSTEASPGAFFFVFWILLGKFAALTHLSLMAVYQLTRVVGAFALLLAAWRFIEHFIEDPKARRFAIFFLAFGMGMGYVVQVLKQTGHPYLFGQQLETLDWRMPELSAYYSILALPHFVWAAAFQAIGVVLTLRAAERGSLRLGALAGLAWLAESLIHAQMPILLGAAIGVAILYRRVSWRGYLAFGVAFAIPLPYVAYSYLAYLVSPEVGRWSAQWRNNLPPDGFSLFWALVPQLALALLALPGAWRRRSRNDVFLVAWLVLLVMILWLPNPAGNLRRRFFDGIYLPLVVLAALGLKEQVWSRLKRVDRQNLFAFTYVLVAAISALVLTLFPMASARDSQYTTSRSRFEGISWLASQPTGIVLSSPSVGLLVPAYTPDTVYVGQYSETFDYQQKSRTVYRLLTSSQDQGSLAGFAAAHQVRYVFWTDEFGGVPPSELGDPAYSGPGVRIFRLY